MKRVKYLGKKKFNVDRIFDMPYMWHGEGDVQECTDADAAKLVKHFPTVYRIVKPGEVEKFNNIKETVENNDNPLERIKIKETDGTEVSLADATYKALADHVSVNMGVKVQEGATKKELMNHIEQITKMREEIVKTPPAAEVKKEMKNPGYHKPKPKPGRPKKTDTLAKKGLAALEDDLF